MSYITAKTILQKSSPYWFGTNYNINLYRGCPHNCIYCDSRSKKYGIPEFTKVKIKKDAIPILKKELRNKKTKGVVGMGAMSDPYNPLEKKYKQTQQALKLIKQYNYGVSIDTKSTLIQRDIPLLEEINKKQSTIIKITITTANDKLSKIIEPQAPPSSERFQTIKKLTQENIFTGILLMPTLPYITDTTENIKQIIKQAHKNNTKFIFPAFGLTLRDQQRKHYYQQLDQHFPGTKEKYQKKYKSQYQCTSPDHKKLETTLQKECKKYNILYTMKDIIQKYQKHKKDTQTKLI